MLKFENQKTTIIRLLITSIKTQTTYTASSLYICLTKCFHIISKIKLIKKDISKRITFTRKNAQTQYQGSKKIAIEKLKVEILEKAF